MATQRRKLFPALIVDLTPIELAAKGLVSTHTFGQQFELQPTTLTASAGANYFPAVRTTAKCRDKRYAYPRDMRCYLASHKFHTKEGEEPVELPQALFNDPYDPPGGFKTRLDWNPSSWRVGDPFPKFDSGPDLEGCEELEGDELLKKAVELLDFGYFLKATGKLLGRSPTVLRELLIDAGEWPRKDLGGQKTRKRGVVEEPEPEEPEPEAAAEEPQPEPEPEPEEPEAEVVDEDEDLGEDFRDLGEPEFSPEGILTLYFENHPFQLTDSNTHPFVIKDACDYLEIQNARQAADRLDKDDVCSTYIIDSLGRPQKTLTCNFPGYLDLVMGARSSDRARPFQRWVTHTVLPTLAKLGTYTLGQEQAAHGSPLPGDLERLFMQQAEINVQQSRINAQHAETISTLEELVGKMMGGIDDFVKSASKRFEEVEERTDQAEERISNLEETLKNALEDPFLGNDAANQDRHILNAIAKARGMAIFFGTSDGARIERQLRICPEGSPEHDKLKSEKWKKARPHIKGVYTAFYRYLLRHSRNPVIDVCARKRRDVELVKKANGAKAAKRFEGIARLIDYIRVEEMPEALTLLVRSCLEEGFYPVLFHEQPRIRELIRDIRYKKENKPRGSNGTPPEPPPSP